MLSRMSGHSVRWSSSSMKGWQVARFGGELQLNQVAIPIINNSEQVLVKVKATSVNPIDTVMCKGYGAEMLGAWKKAAECSLDSSRLPLTPGRDFSGVVEAIGGQVTKFKPGDEVFGVIPAIDSGCHAEFALTTQSNCHKKPQSISFVDAAALPYAASTAWSALVSVARIPPNSGAKENRVLIHGGAGGVGSTAIQLLNAWGAGKIVTTCSQDSFDLVRSLGAVPVDYRSESAKDDLISAGPFEVVFDCVDSDLARWSDNVMGIWRNSVHVSVVSPMLRDTDRYGIPVGLASTAFKHFERAIESHLQGRWFSYAFFMPNEECLRQLAELLESGKVKPIVEKVMPFSDLPSAYEKVSKLKGRGKTVLEL